MNGLKDLILWKYDRETSQYLIFCLLIVAFIFLTPVKWFQRREALATQMTRIVVQSPDFSPHSREFERDVRNLSGMPNAEIIAWQEKRNAKGETFYEIDVR